MYEYDRLQSILDYLRENHSVSVNELAKKFYASEATIRRDLTKLEGKGFVRRFFGGVMLMDNTQTDVPFRFATDNYALKSTVAEKCVDYVHDGDTLMIDASLTASLIIPHLRRFSGLTIITNASMVWPGLQDLDAKLYCTGGLALRDSQGYIGCYAEAAIRNFHADTMFFTCRGITMDGFLTENSAEETQIHKVMFQHSKRHILLMDSTKFGRQYTYNFGKLEDVDVFLTDKPLPWETVQTPSVT